MQALNPVIHVGTIREVRPYRQTSGSTQYYLNPEAAQYTDAALVAYCDGDRHRWGSSVERNPRMVVVTIEKD